VNKKAWNAIGGAIAGLAALTAVVVIILTGRTSLPESLPTNPTSPGANGEMTSAHGLYIDGRLFAAVKNSADAHAVLESIKAAVTDGLQMDAGASVAFVQKVELVPGFYPAAHLMDAQALLEALSKPPLEVKILQIETRVEEVPFETVEYENGDLYRGEYRIRVKGEPGEDKITERVTYVKGVRIGEPEIISRTRVVDPVTERRDIGTKSTVIVDPN